MKNVCMQFVELTKNDKTLVERTRLLLERNRSNISSVSAGLRTDRGTEYFGLSVELDNSPVGMCAEFSAIGTMVSNGEGSIDTMVAICFEGKDEYRILSPCGKCREFLRSFGNPYVIVPQVGTRARQLRKVRLSQLMPLDWSARPT